MAQLQEYFWVLKAASGEDDYKWASGGHDTTPKLYRTEGYAKSAARSAGGDWIPVKVKIQIVNTQNKDNNGLRHSPMV
jgi:hypothetical protein